MSGIDEKRATIERAVFGKQVEDFMNTEVGKYIQIRANEQRSASLIGLSGCDPDDAKLVRTLQNDFKVADSIVAWLGDAINDGLAACQILEDIEE